MQHFGTVSEMSELYVSSDHKTFLLIRKASKKSSKSHLKIYLMKHFFHVTKYLSVIFFKTSTNTIFVGACYLCLPLTLQQQTVVKLQKRMSLYFIGQKSYVLS